MGVFNTLIDSIGSDEREETMPGRNIAVARAEFYGSVHDGGNVTVEVETQYGDREDTAIAVKPSVHGTGDRELTVERIVDRSEAPEEFDLPDGRDGGHETISRRVDYDGNVHGSGYLDLHIDRLVIVPDMGTGVRQEGDDRLLQAFSEQGFEVAQELDARGSVHDRGELDVTIDHLLVME